MASGDYQQVQFWFLFLKTIAFKEQKHFVLWSVWLILMMQLVMPPSFAFSWLWHMVCVRKHAWIGISNPGMNSLNMWSHWTCPWKQLSPSCIQSSLVKENTIYAQTDSVVVGLHWSLLLEPYPTWNSTSFQVRSHSIQSRGLHCQGPVCPYSDPGVVNLMHQVYLLLFLIHVIYLIFESWWFNSVVWRFSVHQTLLVGLLKHRLMSCTEFLSKSVMGQKIHISKFPSDTGAAGA